MNKQTAQMLEQHFDTAFAAPDGIAKLRELILTLAMQGKLVAQDPKDPPASELLQDIEAEKQRLVQDGKIKKPKPLPPIKPEEMPYELPRGWECVRLGNVLSFEYGDNLPANKRSNSGEFPVYGSNGVVGTHKRAFVNEKCIVIGRKGSAGALNICLHDGCCVTDVAYYCIPPTGIDLNFCFKLFHTLKLDSLGKGIKPGLNRNEAYSLVIAIPPLQEQHRIVARIDQLMARCDELEKLRAEREQKRLAVHTAAIKQLLDAPSGSTWDFIQQNFGELYTVKENVAELRKTILQLAVNGGLAPDKDVMRLLPLETTLVEASRNGVSKSPIDDPSATEVLRISAGTSRGDFYVDEDDFKHVLLSPEEVEKFKLQPGDLLACRFNGNLHYVGRFSLYQGCTGRTQVNPDKLIRFRINTAEHCPRYICYAMNASSTRREIESMCATTAGNIGLSAGRLKTVQIPIPSLSQQHQIVNKIDQLMALCDSLEEKIDAGRSKQTELLNGLLAALPKKRAEVTDLAAYRSSVGCYVVGKLASSPYFGRTAAAKVFFLAQAHVGLSLDFHPVREAAGPLDQWIYGFEQEGKNNGWFEVSEKQTKAGYVKTEYKTMQGLNTRAMQAEKFMTEKERSELDGLINLLSDKKTEEVEIIATLFAAWNDLLIDGCQPDDNQIIAEVRENWHEKKKRFSPDELRKWLSWLRRNQLVPQGRTPRTIQQARFNF